MIFMTENRQFEFFQKEKVSRTRFVTEKILFSIHFFELWFKKSLEMTNFLSFLPYVHQWAK